MSLIGRSVLFGRNPSASLPRGLPQRILAQELTITFLQVTNALRLHTHIFSMFQIEFGEITLTPTLFSFF